MKATEPRIQKRLGDEIKCGRAKEAAWMMEAEKIMREGVKAKMEQNDRARNALLATEDDVLGEASRDPIWGTGVAIHHKNATIDNLWPGGNLLGKIMSEIRELYKAN